MEGPSAIRLWPGLYFDSDTQTKTTKGGKKLLKGEGLAAKYKVKVVGKILSHMCEVYALPGVALDVVKTGID